MGDDGSGLDLEREFTLILEAAGVRSPSREVRARHRDASPSANGAAGAGCGRVAAGEAQALDHSGDGAGMPREVVASSPLAGRVGVRRGADGRARILTETKK